MSLQSDISINYAAFDPSAVPPETRAMNEAIQKHQATFRKWYEYPSIAEFRQLQKEGKTFEGAPAPLASGAFVNAPSRDNGRTIRCRVFKPESVAEPKGIFLHFHGGGWVLNNETLMDNYLHRICNSHELVCISVGYRLAPEHKFPAGMEDCFDVAEWLIDHGPDELGAKLAFIGGESAGGHLTLMTTLHLLSSSNSGYAGFRLKGIIPHYPSVDLTSTPSTKTNSKSPPLIMDYEMICKYRDTIFPPETRFEDRKKPTISPLYVNLKGLELPPVLFTVGTEDPLLDDTLFMSVRWMVAGGTAIVKVLPGAYHAYIENPDLASNEIIKKGFAHVNEFLVSKLR